MSNTSLPRTYQGESHPLFPFNKSCVACSLGKKDELSALPGSGPDDLTKVKLIVISDNPGHYEIKHQYNFYSNDTERAPKYNPKIRRNTLEGWRNAGSLIRWALNNMFGLDTYLECYFTNALKCNPDQQTVTEKHIKTCVRTWLQSEITVLDDYCSEVPILIAGNTAYKGLKALSPELAAKLPSSLKDARRSANYFYKAHPLVFTYNPAAFAKGEAKVEYRVGLTRKQTYQVLEVKAMPVQVGSPLWMFGKDLELLAPHLNKIESHS